MDRVTADIDRKSIRNLTVCIYGALVFIVIATLISIYCFGSHTFTNNDAGVYERITADGIFLMGYILSAIVCAAVGKEYNYTDMFRVRREYSFAIRKRSLLIYSPFFAIPVLLSKVAASYYELSEGGYSLLHNASFLLICYLFYFTAILYLATVITLLNKVVTVLVYAISPWIICQLSITGICKDIISHENMLIFLVAAFLIMADTYVMMGRLKKRILSCDMK